MLACRVDLLFLISVVLACSSFPSFSFPFISSPLVSSRLLLSHPPHHHHDHHHHFFFFFFLLFFISSSRLCLVPPSAAPRHRHRPALLRHCLHHVRSSSIAGLPLSASSLFPACPLFVACSPSTLPSFTQFHSCCLVCVCVSVCLCRSYMPTYVMLCFSPSGCFVGVILSLHLVSFCLLVCRYFQECKQYSSTMTGVRFLPVAAAIMVSSIAAGMSESKYGR